MHPVLIECPQTRGLVPTGFTADHLDELEAENMLFDCPACGGDHPWTPADAVITRRVGA